MTEPAPEKRIGDRERREVDAHLRQAHDDGVLTLTEYDERAGRCWAARTRSDLEALVRDLPEHRLEPARVPPPDAAAPAPTGGRSRSRVGRAIAVGVALLCGVQIVGADDAVAIFSSRVVQVTPDQDHVDVGVLFGSVEVVVPADAQVDTDGVVIFGGTDCEDACDGTGTRVVTVSARGGFGNVDVVRPGERIERRGDSDRDDEDDD